MSEDRWMVRVSPFDPPGCWVQRGYLHTTPEAAEEERKEWAEVYESTKVVKCRPVDIRIYAEHLKL